MSSHINKAIYVKDVSFSYGDLLVLNAININIEKGQIYGLLGASGCGKTTLLRCILSRLKPKSGQILIFGSTPGSEESQIPGAGIGFMPQELCLHLNFSIEETLKYFGKIFSLKKTQVEQKINSLIDLLQLPNKSKLVGKLSCGQQRRVSLAATLIHSPPLLILDEPTVGVDAVLRKTIWNHLQTLCSSGLTIIITTHYIEEARSASMIGFMRDGKILTEENPDKLMQRYNETNLENTLLKVCEQQNILRCGDNENSVSFQAEINEAFSINDEMSSNDTKICENNHPLNKEENKKSSQSKRKLTKNIDNKESYKSVEFDSITLESNLNSSGTKSTFCGKLKALFYKNILRVRRTLFIHILYTFKPTLFSLLAILCIGTGPKDLSLGIHNTEIKNSCVNNWRNLFIDCIDNKTFNIINYESFDDGYKDIENGKIWALIEISESFSQSTKTRKISGNDMKNKTLFNSRIHVYIDMSNQVISFYIKKLLYEAMEKFAENLARENNINPNLIKSPLIFKDPPVYGKYKESSRDFILPGLFVMIITYASSSVLIHIILEERLDGIMERSIVSGVTAFQFLLSQIIIQTIVVLIQVLLLIILCFPIFRLPNEGSLLLLFLLLFSQGMIGIMFGILIASISKDAAFSSIMSIALLSLYVAIGGVYWPVQNSPGVIQWLSIFLPSTLPIESLRSVMFKGWGIQYFQVYVGFIVTYTWFFTLIIISVFLLRRQFY